MSESDARCQSRVANRAHVGSFARGIYWRRSFLFELTENIDKIFKQLQEKFNYTQWNYIIYCPVPQQKHEIRYRLSSIVWF